MPLLFKMQKTLVTFNLALILQVGIPDISKLLRNVLLRNAERLEKKKKSHVNCLITYMFMGLEHEKKIMYTSSSTK